jgi:hypothetical protein
MEVPGFVRGLVFSDVRMVRIVVSRHDLNYKPQKRAKYISGNYGIQIYVRCIQGSRKDLREYNNMEDTTVG